MHDYAYCGLDCKNCEYKEKCNCDGRIRVLESLNNIDDKVMK
jgi:hypothetical protein